MAEFIQQAHLRIEMKTIVVSAVNLRKGGTLNILRQCLEYLSHLKEEKEDEYRIIALVHKKSLASFNNIEYIEIPWAIRSWGHRLWCEYITMFKISKELGTVDLWLSLHDTTPRVKAIRQAVYCQTSFPFFRWTFNDFRFDFKIPLFAIFTKYAYLVNIKKNRYLIVQQEWLRDGFSKMFNLKKEQFIVAPPPRKKIRSSISVGDEFHSQHHKVQFFYPATPDCHKNFEVICRAAQLLEREIGCDKFKIILTINGTENKYAKWLHHNWGHLSSLSFVGFLDEKTLYHTYSTTDCLIFPSRIETWGLPISEFLPSGKLLLLADLPYAHETSPGASSVSFFDAMSSKALKEQMKKIIDGDLSSFTSNPEKPLLEPYAHTWRDLFVLLLS